MAAPQLAAEVQLPGPGEEGKKAVSMTDRRAGGMGAAALTGGALILCKEAKSRRMLRLRADAAKHEA